MSVIMRELVSFIVSWLAVTTVFVIAINSDGLLLTSDSAYTIIGLVSVFTGIYFIVVGLPVFYFLSKYKKVVRSAFIYAGILASIPILALSIATQETEWVIGSILGGIIGGLVFALLLPFKKYT